MSREKKIKLKNKKNKKFFFNQITKNLKKLMILGKKRILIVIKKLKIN